MAGARGPAAPGESLAPAGPRQALGSCSALTPPAPPRPLGRLSEQTLLVQTLTEQNLKKGRTISSLRADVQRLVRPGKGGCGAGASAPC